MIDDGDLANANINGGMCGCIVLLWEEDDTSDLEVHFAQLAYSSAIRTALNNHVAQNGLVQPSGAQLDAIIGEVKSKVEDSIVDFQKVGTPPA